jgi:hypothetical protein
MVCSICPEIFSFMRYTLPSNGVAPFSTVLFFTTIVLLGLLKTLVHGRVQLWLTDRGMQDKYCTMLLTLGTCNNWAGHATLCWSTSCGRQCVSMSAAAASPWDRECNTYGTCGSRSPTYCTDTNRWRCHNCCCGMKAVMKRVWYYARIETIPTNGLWSTSWYSLASKALLAELIYTCFQAIVFYKCNFASGSNINTLWMSSFYTNSVGRRHVLCLRLRLTRVTLIS